jgi:hypothetical protein
MKAAAILLLAASPVLAQAPKDPEGWAQHDVNRPQPTVVDPGIGVPPETPGKPPADAVVLFDGKDLSAWKSSKDGSGARWKVENGYFEVVPKTGGIETKATFGDAQLHIEWMAPSPAKGTSQDRGNSGVFFGGTRYEIQVLDSYENKTYPDGQAGSIYGQYPPLVNASRPPGQWQAYDIVFPRQFDAASALRSPARDGHPAAYRRQRNADRASAGCTAHRRTRQLPSPSGSAHRCGSAVSGIEVPRPTGAVRLRCRVRGAWRVPVPTVRRWRDRTGRRSARGLGRWAQPETVIFGPGSRRRLTSRCGRSYAYASR